MYRLPVEQIAARVLMSLFRRAAAGCMRPVHRQADERRHAVQRTRNDEKSIFQVPEISGVSSLSGGKFMRDHTHHLFFGRADGPGVFMLDDSEAHHLLRVLRASPGDTITATDGNGSVYTCIVETSRPETCTARITQTVHQPRPPLSKHFFVGIPRREAFSHILESLAPFDVESITPVVCSSCQEKWWERKREKHRSRFRALLIAGAKQSLSPFLPSMNDAAGFTAAVESAPGTIVFGDPDGVRFRGIEKNLSSAQTVSCFIGPPGGFTQEETGALLSRNAVPLHLGPRRLRTETACFAAASLLVQI